MSFTSGRPLRRSSAQTATSDLPPAYSDSTSSGAIAAPAIRFARTDRSLRYLTEDVTDDDDDVLLRSLLAGRAGDAEDEDHTGNVVVRDLPPVYTPFDEKPKIFSFCDSIINTVSADRVQKPRYQLRQQMSQSGRLWRLQIRRLLPSESRRLSMSCASELHVDFDADTMLYEVENLAALYSIRNKLDVEIKGRKAGTLQGHIEFCSTGRDGHEFKHCTRPAAKHWSREENI